MKDYDVIVIGAGPAGYVAAIRAAQLGKKVACVDKWLTKNGKPALGGTCLNVGCIPSKALLESSEHYKLAKEGFSEHGIKIGGVGIDIEQMIERKEQIVTQLTDGINQLFQANKVDWLQGEGTLLADKSVKVTHHNGDMRIYQAKDIILATGSKPISISAAPIDNHRVIDSEGGLCLTEVPKKLAIIGAGVIGLEMASIWSRLGSEVIIFEAMNEFLSFADRAIAKEAFKQYKKQGFDIKLGARVTGTNSKKKEVLVEYEYNGEHFKENFDYLLVAVGRAPFTENLFDSSLDLTMDGNRILVDEECRTSIPDIWAIGDLVRGPMLAHKGSEEGIAVAERIAGRYGYVDYDLIPSVIYTNPEIAWVGKTEEMCKQENIEYHIGTFPFAASGRAKAMDETAGFVKIIADRTTDKILGAHVIGANASELIHEIIVAMSFDASSEDVARIVHAHPTLSEAVKEAALSVHKEAIHIINK